MSNQQNANNSMLGHIIEFAMESESNGVLEMKKLIIGVRYFQKALIIIIELN